MYQMQVYENTAMLYQGLMNENSYMTGIELELVMRVVNKKNRKDNEDDVETKKIDLDQISFEQLLDMSINRNLIEIQSAIKLVTDCENLKQRMTEERPRLNIIIARMGFGNEKWRTLQPVVFRSRLDALEQAVDNVKEDILILGWLIYSQELYRIEVCYLNDN